MKKTMWLSIVAIFMPVIIPLIIVLGLFMALGGSPNGLAASADKPEKIQELLSLKSFGIPYDIVMMIASYPCKNQEEADEARFVFIAMDFMIVEEQVEVFVCICPPPVPTPEDPDPVGECTCDNWEVQGSNVYNGKNQILSYLKITEENKDINCVSIEAKLNEAAAAKETSSSRYSIISIGSAEKIKFESIIKSNKITQKEDVEGIIQLHEEGYFIEWLDQQDAEGGGVGTTPDIEGSKYIMPVAGHITSAFGYRIHPLTGKPNMHTGVDIGSEHYSNIVSVYEGEVVGIGTDEYDGRYVLIYHSEDDFYSYYGHLSQWKVKVGNSVSQGQTIGIEGGDPGDPEPGWSTGHHLHFEIWNSSKQAINPIKFLKQG